MDAESVPKSLQQVEQEIQRMVTDLQSQYLIPRQKEAFLCCASCCDGGPSVSQLEECVRRCSTAPSQAQQTIQAQLQQFQERYQRVVMQCQDVAKDSVSSYNPTPAEQNKAKAKFHSCMEESGRNFLERIPRLKADIVAQLNTH